MSFFVKAVVEALKAFPDFNSYIEGNEIVSRNYYDIGIAVGAKRGLVVQAIRGCDWLSFADIEKQIASFAQKARESKLTIDDIKGGGFTITNGGVYGSMLSTPIPNPPQVGILGMHNIIKCPVVVNDEMVIRPMMYLALSYYHRLVDGKRGGPIFDKGQRGFRRSFSSTFGRGSKMMETVDLVVLGSWTWGLCSSDSCCPKGIENHLHLKREDVGGTCLKCRMHSLQSPSPLNKNYHRIAHGKEHGIECSGLSANLSKMMERKGKIVSGITSGVAFLFKSIMSPFSGDLPGSYTSQLFR